MLPVNKAGKIERMVIMTDTRIFTTPNGIIIKNNIALFNYINTIASTFMSTDFDMQDPCIVYRTNQYVHVEVQDAERILDLTFNGIDVYSFNSVEEAYECIKYLYVNRKEDPELVILNNRPARGPRRRA